MPQTRKHYLDYLRVLAIAAVIVIHVTAIFYSRTLTSDPAGWWMANVLNAASRFCVPLFVMISGAVLLGRPIGTGDFYRSRFLRLVPPLLFWSLVFLGLKMHQGMDLAGLFWELKIGLIVEGRAYTHLWFLSMFLCLMLFAPFINKFIIGERPSRSDLLILIGLAAFFFAFNSFASVTRELLGLNIGWFKQFPWYIAYFILGYFIDTQMRQSSRTGRLALVAVLVLTGLAIALNYLSATSLGVVKDYFVLNNTGLPLLLITAAIFLVAHAYASRLRDSHLIRHISDASFGIYLIHPLFIYALMNTLPDYLSHGLVYMPLVIVVTAVLSYLSIRLMRESRLLRRFC